MAKKKLSTQEILAAARGEVAGGGDATPEAESTPAPPSQPAAASAGKPTSTKDILAAARAAASAGSADAAPAAPAPKKTTAKTAAKPAGGAPKSTKDILAAARAAASGGSADAPASESPKSKAAAKPATVPEGEQRSVQEMLAALKEGKTTEQIAAAAAPKKPVTPTKPARAKKPAKADADTRRNFLVLLVATPFAFGWSMLAGACLAATLGTLRFMMPNVLVEPPSRFKIGPPSDYPAGTVSTKWKAEFGVWIVNSTYKGQSLVYALSSVCTHLGCTPNWLEGEQKFKCPCHGSGFYITGVNFEGPAPRPLERVGLRVAEDGMLEVDKGVKFQQEMGQWGDPASMVEIS
jgi:cytochrome b6-f complex iron-sulfur subunit